MLNYQRVLFYLFGNYYRITQSSKQNPLLPLLNCYMATLLSGLNHTLRRYSILTICSRLATIIDGIGIRDLIKQRIPANNLCLVPFSVAAYPHYSVAVSLVCSLVRSSSVM